MSQKNVNRPGYKKTPVGVWDCFPLSDVAEIIVSNVDKKTKSGELPIRLCNYTDVYYNSYIHPDMDFMQASATAAEIEKFALKKNDVLITKDSETPGDIAVPALITEDLSGVICGYHLAILRPNPDRLDGGYLSSLLRLQTMRQYFFTLANGVTRFGLSIDAIANAEIPLPPLPEQHRIAEILYTWDRAIEQTWRLLDACRRRKQAFMQKLLTGQWRFPEFGKPAKNGELPKGWKRLAFESIATINPSAGMTRAEKNMTVSFIPMSSVSERGGIEHRITKNLDEIGNGYTPFCENDILVAKITPCFENGKGAIASGLINGIGFGSTEFHVIRCHADQDNYYFYQITLTSLFRKKGISNMTGSAGQKRIPAYFIEQFPVDCPSLPEQQKITEVLSVLDSEIRAMQNSLDKLQTQKRGLMQKLLTGEIRV